MPIRTQKQYRFVPPSLHETKDFADFSLGLDTASTEVAALLTVAKNVRLNGNSLFDKRLGSLQKGNTIGAASKILGLHSYVTKNQTARLMASYGTDVYSFSEANTPATIATSSDPQGIGWSKDRHVFMTTAHTDATASLPFCVVLYQTGSGIKLEWESSPYTGWAHTVISVDASVSKDFSCYMDSNDNVHVVYCTTTAIVKYVKLTYGAGPTWNVGSAVTITDGTPASQLRELPSVIIDSNGVLYATYRITNSSAEYKIAANYSTDGGVTWPNELALGSSSGGSPLYSSAITLQGSTPIIVRQYNSTGTVFTYATSSWQGNGAWSGFTNGATVINITDGTTTTSTANGTLNAFSVISTDTTTYIYVDPNGSSNGLSTMLLGTSGTPQRKIWNVAHDGSNDNDIQYKNVINGVTDMTATRVTNDSNNNLYPSVPAVLSTSPNFTPVVFMVGTSNPYSIKVNSATQWTAMGNSLTAGTTINSCTMPFTAAGGTDQHYFVNGVDTPFKWDGTTVTGAGATGYPKAAWIFPMDDRLWMGGEIGKESYARYTALGSDSFSGTFPATNIVGLPEGILWGHWYRDSTAIFFTRQSLYIIQNYDYSGVAVGPNAVRKIPDSYGILSGRTVKQVGGYVYYQRPDGQIMRTNTQTAECVSERIAPTLGNLALSQLQSAAAGTLGFYYYLAVASSGSGVNDTMIALDTRKALGGEKGGGFSIDVGKNCSVMVTHPDQNGVPQIYYGDSSPILGKVYQMEIGLSDNGNAIDMDLQTGIFALSGLYLNDLLRDILVLASASGSFNLTVGVAKATSTSSFTNFTVNLSPNSGVWGIGIWNPSLVWGGSANIVQNISGINITSTGHKIRFRNNAANQPVGVISFALTHEPVRDRT